MHHADSANHSAAARGLAPGDPAAIRFCVIWIAGVLAVFLAARLLTPGTGGQLNLAGFGVPLPELCSFRTIAGFDCPGCGLTRSFVLAARFQLSQAWAMHPVGMLLVGYLTASIPLRLWRIHRLLRHRPVRPTWRWELAIAAALTCAMYVRWISLQFG